MLFRNILWFVFHFFSIGLLLRTFASPWQRLGEAYSRSSGSSFFETFVINTIMRLVGMCVRTVVIACGLVALACTFILELCAAVVWVFMPFIIVFLFVSGLRLLI